MCQADPIRFQLKKVKATEKSCARGDHIKRKTATMCVILPVRWFEQRAHTVPHDYAL